VDSGDSLARVPCRACVDPPSALSLNAMAMPSTRVDFPVPLSPTRTVAGPRSRDRRAPRTSMPRAIRWRACPGLRAAAPAGAAADRRTGPTGG
jgi:hypothetical protein